MWVESMPVGEWVQQTNTWCQTQKAVLLRIAISGHVEFIRDQQQCFNVGSCLGALQGQEVRDIHVG